jgi:hypothetical protein
MDWEKPCSGRLAEWREERAVLCRELTSKPDVADSKAAMKRIRLLSFLLERYEAGSRSAQAAAPANPESERIPR